MTRPYPPRLHVLLAREAATAVVIRRGPARKVGIFGWDRATDRITPGQWLNGRIYERRCDLSPDGRHMIYFAMNGRWSDPVSKGSWTAISRAPYLKAVTFYPQGDCWGGGGLFLDDRRYWLNGGGWPGEHGWEDRGLVRVKTLPKWSFKSFQRRCPPYSLRLVRDGWTPVIGAGGDRLASLNPDHLTRDLALGWRLEKWIHFGDFERKGGPLWEAHALVSPGAEILEMPDWEWADRDGDAVVFARRGGLWRQRIAVGGGLDEPALIHDFAADTYEEREAPY